jgi:glycine cleavage system H protein
MATPVERRYSEEHEWVLMNDGVATIGITDFAQEELGDIVFVELPAVGAKLQKEGRLGVVESVKAVSDVYAPLSGTVVAVNEKLTANPEIVNQDPYGEGWMIRLQCDDPAEIDALMTADGYDAFVAKEKA